MQMAIASPSAPTFSAFSASTKPQLPQFLPQLRFRHTQLHRCVSVSASLDGGELMHELLHYGQQQLRRWKGYFPVYVKLPVDAVGATAVRWRKAMAQSFKALAAAGVEGVVMDEWWGLVDRDFPNTYN